MQQSKTRIYDGNAVGIRGKKKPQSIHFLAKNFIRNTSSLELGNSFPDFTYEEMLEYAELLYLFLKKDYPKRLEDVNKKDSYHKSDSLVKAVSFLEHEVNSVYEEVNIESFRESKAIQVKEWVPFMNNTIFDMNMNIIRTDINENLKVGLAKAFVKIFHFANYDIMEKAFIELYVDSEMDPVLDYVFENDYLEQDDDYSAKRKIFDVEVTQMVKDLHCVMDEFRKYASMEFDKDEVCDDDEEEMIRQCVIRILDFDMGIINCYRDTDQEMMDYGEWIQMEYIFVPVFYGVTDFVECIFDCHTQSRVDDFNHMGCECLLNFHTIEKDSITSNMDPHKAQMHQFEKDIFDMIKFSSNKNNYYE